MKNKVESLLLQPRLRICITRLCVGNSDSDEQIKCDTDIVTIFTRNTIPLSMSMETKTISNTNNIVNRKKWNFSVGKKRHRNESCLCGNKYCNSVAKFLGSVVNAKCHYKRPSVFDNKRFPKKLKRSKIIHSRVQEWRKDQNRSPPSRTARFNEIHFSIVFLKEHKEWSRLPMEISLDLAARSKMFDHDFVWDNKTLVIPTLKTHEAIQVSYKNMYDCLIMLLLKHNEHTSGSHLERYHNFRYIPDHKTSGQVPVHVFVLQLLFPILREHLSTTII